MSLAETVLGATILALAAAAILSLLPSTLLSVRRSERQLQAGALAQSLLERQKLVYFPDLVVGTNQQLSSQFTPDGIELKPVLTVTAASGSARRVRVTVSWKEREKQLGLFREIILARLPR